MPASHDRPCLFMDMGLDRRLAGGVFGRSALSFSHSGCGKVRCSKWTRRDRAARLVHVAQGAQKSGSCCGADAQRSPRGKPLVRRLRAFGNPTKGGAMTVFPSVRSCATVVVTSRRF